MEKPVKTIGECPYMTVQRLLAGKWSLMILCYLRAGSMRFGELKHCLEDVSDVTQATLTKALRKLENDGLVLRTVYAEVPPRVEYSLTPIGRDLSPILESLGDFGAKYLRLRGENNICAHANKQTCRCCIL